VVSEGNSKHHPPEHGRIFEDLTCLLYSFILQEPPISAHTSNSMMIEDTVISDASAGSSTENNDVLKRVIQQDTSQPRKKIKIT